VLQQLVSETTTSAVVMYIEFSGAATLRRDNTIIATSAAGVISSGTNFTDTNFVNNVNEATDLAAGTSYQYTLTDASTTGTETMCTRALPPSQILATALGQDSARVFITANPGNPGPIGSYEIINLNGSFAQNTTTAETIVTNMDPPFSTHEFQVTQLFECQSTTPVFINSETTTSNVIRLAPEYPVIVSAAAAAQSGDITLDFNLTNLASDLRYNLYRDNTLIKTFLFSEYENFTIVTSGDYTDSGLARGNEFAYKLEADDQISGLKVITNETKACTYPAAVTTASYENKADQIVAVSWDDPGGSYDAFSITVGSSPAFNTTSNPVDIG
ncbi:uncharacterized protein LOC142356544, partial [Convolutriloba macropyga]|uniref:uncharacterized protein LOC142356544 n=1 Tax=Convolutriloba macropyga TaxID=536237 RepID=UPI003F51D02B